MKKIKLGYLIHALFYFSMGAFIVGQPWKESRETMTIAQEICESKELGVQAVVTDTKHYIKIICKKED